MKKIAPYIAAVVLFGSALALEICYVQAKPSLPSTYYDGIYVDLMAQAEYDAWRASNDPSKQPAYMLKVDQQTGLPVCMTSKQGDKTEVNTSFIHDGTKYDLRFVDHVLVGVRKSYSEEREALAAELGTSWDALSDVQRENIEREAFEIIWNNRTWVRDTAVLKPILDDYAAQVQAVADAARSAE